MFLSLWLFVEFVFLGKKYLCFSDLKVIANHCLQFFFMNYMCGRMNTFILTLVQLAHHLWHEKRTGKKEKTVVSYEETTKGKYLCYHNSNIVWWRSWRHSLHWILRGQNHALVVGCDFMDIVVSCYTALYVQALCFMDKFRREKASKNRSS